MNGHPFTRPNAGRSQAALQPATRASYALLAAALIGGALATAPHTQANETFLVAPTGRPIDPGSTYVARLQYYFGTHASLDFIRIDDSDGQPLGVAVAENKRIGVRSVMNHDGLDNADALELFVALSEPGTPVPRMFADVYGDNGVERALSATPQGWGRPAQEGEPSRSTLDLVDELIGHHGNSACSAGINFLWEIADLDYPLRFLSEGNGPATEPTHWGPDGLGYRTTGYVTAVAGFAARVRYCVQDESQPINYFQDGPKLQFHYRSDPANSWSQLYYGNLLSPGDEIVFAWHPVAHPFESGYTPEDPSFRMILNYVADADEFDIEAAWSKPQGTLTSR